MGSIPIARSIFRCLACPCVVLGRDLVCRSVPTVSTDLRSAAVLARYGIAASPMHKMLKVLDSRGLVRVEETIGSIRYRLEDPFFARWLGLVQASA